MRFLVHPLEVDLTGERHQRRPVQERVRDPRHEIRGPRSQSPETHTCSAGEAAVHVGDERAGLLVTHRNELDRRPIERLAEVERLFAGDPEYEPDPLRLEALDQDLRRFGHSNVMSWRATSPPSSGGEPGVDLPSGITALTSSSSLSFPARYQSTYCGMSMRKRFEPMFEPWSFFSSSSWNPSICDLLAERDHADDGGGAALAQHVERLLRGRVEADRLERVVDAAAGELDDGEHRIGRGRVDDVGGAERLRELELRRDTVDRDDATGADDGGALDHVQADAAAADDGDGLARRGPAPC